MSHQLLRFSCLIRRLSTRGLSVVQSHLQESVWGLFQGNRAPFTSTAEEFLLQEGLLPDPPGLEQLSVVHAQLLPLLDCPGCMHTLYTSCTAGVYIRNTPSSTAHVAQLCKHVSWSVPSFSTPHMTSRMWVSLQGPLHILFCSICMHMSDTSCRAYVGFCQISHFTAYMTLHGHMAEDAEMICSCPLHTF